MARRGRPKKYEHVGAGTVKNVHGVKIKKREREFIHKSYHKLYQRRRYHEETYEQLAPPSQKRFADPVVPKPRKPIYSLDEFKTRGQLEAYIKRTEKQLRKGFVASETARYRNNLKAALNKVFEGEERELVAKIDRLSDAEFKRLIASEPRIWNIEYIYEDERQEKLQELENKVDEVKGT